uniref:NADH-ubiquinone oxidoreductase chain 4L n=1 Tax=Salminus brasiliensis TaxID=930266 RepID=A0A0U1V6C5_SALBR|nr:NADH dehydrogenase subunit 4L [Salminus brasiliensis]AIN79173.1 NADH dehydrogenase subunit 4L [Salminus brasiliensis]ARS00843.1 NADH dehydrogenase subunit 4L [Salminus brasiliensis]
MTSAHFTFTSSFFLGLAGLALHRVHLLSALLCLEGMMLSLFVALSLWALQLKVVFSSTSPMYLLAFSACEAGVGLALLVATTRTHGTDRMNNLVLLQC